MTSIPGLIPGTKLTLQVQKPKAVRMHSFLDLEEFQSTTKHYGQTIDWPEWRRSPRIGSEQFYQFVDERVIDLEEVRRAGVVISPRPRNEKLSEMKAVIPEREIFAHMAKGSKRGGGIDGRRRTRSHPQPPEDIPEEVEIIPSDGENEEDDEIPRSDSSSPQSGGDENVVENPQESKEQGVQGHQFLEARGSPHLCDRNGSKSDF